MRAWLAPLAEALDRGEAAMLVHIVALKGSGPREVGAQMLVTESGAFGTIGGGELEHCATLKARDALSAGHAGIVRLALGPELNQCCGGSVTLAFEPFAPADRAWVKKLTNAADGPEPVFRTVRLYPSGELRRDWERGDGDEPDYAVYAGGRGSGSSPSQPPPEIRARSAPPDFDLPSRGRLRAGLAPESGIASDAVEIREWVNPPDQALWLFGAGHVGRAVAKAMHPLGFAITWIDGRAGQFPEPPLPGVKTLALAMPELAVDEAPDDTIFLVMTHSHPLDQAICEAVLRRQDFAYLGLIGSQTKRARFVKRLGEAGIPATVLDRLVCPIGLPGIGSKEPAAIAASVAADLLLRRERNLFRRKDSALHGR